MNNVGNPLYILNNKMQKNSPNQAKKKPQTTTKNNGRGKVRTTTNKSLSVQKLHLQNNPGRVSNGTIHLHHSGKRRESSERIVGSRSSEIFADNATEA